LSILKNLVKTSLWLAILSVVASIVSFVTYIFSESFLKIFVESEQDFSFGNFVYLMACIVLTPLLSVIYEKAVLSSSRPIGERSRILIPGCIGFGCRSLVVSVAPTIGAVTAAYMRSLPMPYSDSEVLLLIYLSVVSVIILCACVGIYFEREARAKRSDI